MMGKFFDGAPNHQVVVQQARAEVAEENFRQAVDEMKVRMRRVKWWHKFVPFVIRIERRK